MNKKQINKGISLIVLVITILVLIVLAGAVILTVAKNNPLKEANEAVYKSGLKNLVSELSLTSSSLLLQGKQSRNINAIGSGMIEYIPTIKNQKLFQEILEIIEGKIYILLEKATEEETKWALEIGIEGKGRRKKPVITNISLEVGTDRVKVTTEVSESQNGVKSYTYQLRTEHETVKDVTKKENCNEFINLKKNTKYYIKVIVTDGKDNKIESSEKEFITEEVTYKGEIKIDLNPNLSEGIYTNQNVTAIITYPVVENLKGRYSYDGVNWNDYTTPITITKNGTIYAIMTDSSNNESNKGTTAKKVNNIDKLNPQNFTFTVTVAEEKIEVQGTTQDTTQTDEYAKSGIASYLYKVNDGNWIDGNGVITGLSEGTMYKVYMKARDKSGNEKEADNNGKQVTTLLKNTPPIIQNTTIEKGVNELKFKVTATDRENDELIYKICTRKTGEIEYIEKQNVQAKKENEVILTAGGLELYTEYDYKIEVADPKNEKNFHIGNSKTMCSGITQICTVGTIGNLCSGVTMTCSGTSQCNGPFNRCVHGLIFQKGEANHSYGGVKCYPRDARHCVHGNLGAHTVNNCTHGRSTTHQYCAHNTNGVPHYYGAVTCVHR